MVSFKTKSPNRDVNLPSSNVQKYDQPRGATGNQRIAQNPQHTEEYENVEYDEYGQIIAPKGLNLRRHFVSEIELDDTILNMAEDQTTDP